MKFTGRMQGVKGETRRTKRAPARRRNRPAGANEGTHCGYPFAVAKDIQDWHWVLYSPTTRAPIAQGYEPTKSAALRAAATKAEELAQARRPNIHDADASEQATLTHAQQNLLQHVEQNYKQLSVLRAQYGGDIDALIAFRLVECDSGICHLTGMGREAAQMLRGRRGNPHHQVDLLRPGYYMTYVKATADSSAPQGGTESPPAVLYATSLAELSTAVREWIGKTDTGATSFTAGNSGRVFDDHGMLVAYISYNGRIWEAGEAGRRDYEITGRMAKAPLRRRLNPGRYDDSTWIRLRVRATPSGLSDKEVRERFRLMIQQDDQRYGVVTDRNTREAMLRSAVKMYDEIHPNRRANPALAVLNPPARRANASVQMWSSDDIAGPYGRIYRVTAEWDKHDGYRVVTNSISPEERAAGQPWHDEKITPGYRKDIVELAARERASYLRRKFRNDPNARRSNPALAILNPLPEHLERFAIERELTPAEREDFNRAIAKYCEFHGVQPEDISITELGDDDVPEVMATHGANRFLVAMGDTEDTSYSANHKTDYQDSNKRGTPFKHEYPSKPTMATDPTGQMIFIINKPGQADHFVVADWIRG